MGLEWPYCKEGGKPHQTNISLRPFPIRRILNFPASTWDRPGGVHNHFKSECPQKPLNIPCCQQGMSLYSAGGSMGCVFVVHQVWLLWPQMVKGANLRPHTSSAVHACEVRFDT